MAELRRRRTGRWAAAPVAAPSGGTCSVRVQLGAALAACQCSAGLRSCAAPHPAGARAGFAAVYKGWPRTKPLKWVALLVFALATIAACTSFFFMKQARPRAACL